MAATLETCTPKNTKRWSFDGLVTLCKIVKVYDGDTLTVAFDTLGRGPHLHQVRLLGVDTPELASEYPAEVAAAKAARDWLRGIADQKIATLTVSSTDKYGRLLSTVSVDGLDLSRALLDAGYARPYDGGARPPFATSTQ